VYFSKKKVLAGVVPYFGQHFVFKRAFLVNLDSESREVVKISIARFLIIILKVLHQAFCTVIQFHPKLREFLRFPPYRNFGNDFVKKKIITISDRLVGFWFFVLLFWPVWGLNPGLFGLKVNNGDQWTKRLD
jgi:hypothetical protein